MIENEARFFKIVDQSLGQRLLSPEGIMAEDLDDLLGSTIKRMNLVGSLRGEGFDIVGGRGEPYRVLGWSRPAATKFDWTNERTVVKAFLDHLAPLDLSDGSRVSDLLSLRDSTRYHESSFGYLWGYEAVGQMTPGRAYAYLLGDQDEKVVIQRRFSSAPRLRLIDINFSADRYPRLITLLTQLSSKPVEIRNLTPSKIKFLMSAFPETIVSKSHQSVYDTEKIVTRARSFFSKKSWKSVSKNLREIEFTEVSIKDPKTKQDAIFVIDTWRKKRSDDQLRLAIGRDYALVDTNVPTCYYIMGYRDDAPVSLRVLSRIPQSSSSPEEGDGAADLIEKSFNYSDLPGGHSGMSDASLLATCAILASKGIKYINGGESLSVSPQLHQYKNKFEAGSIDAISLVPQSIESLDLLRILDYTQEYLNL